MAAPSKKATETLMIVDDEPDFLDVGRKCCFC
jgi:hypothetical protein